MDGKFSVAYPSKGEKTLVKDQPADNGPGAVMILGTISNSPLGMFAPGELISFHLCFVAHCHRRLQGSRRPVQGDD